MKSKIIVLLTCAFIVGGCATDNNGSGSDQQKAAQADKDKKPEIGMTKDQILAMYGKTDNIQASSEGETWIYNMNMGEAFIPWNFGYHPKMRIVTFDKDGKVVHWNYSN
jgi:predicted small secreted protein